MNKFIEGGQKREVPKEKKKINWVKIGVIGGVLFIGLIIVIAMVMSGKGEKKQEETDDKAVWIDKYYEYLVSSNILKGSTQTRAALIDFDDNGTPELVLKKNTDDQELIVLYIQGDKAVKSRDYIDGEIKLMYEINDKKAKWYLSEIDSGFDYYTDLSKLAQGNDEDITKKKEILMDYEDTTVVVDYKNISAGTVEDDLKSLSNSYNKDFYINDTLDQKMEKILQDRSNSGNIDEVYKSFILEKKYNNYIDAWTSSPNKYLFFDLNGDGTKELFIAYADTSSWYRMLIMTFDEKTHVLYKVGEIYAYQGLYFNSQEKDFYYYNSQPTGTNAISNYYKMENHTLTYEKKLFKENGSFYRSRAPYNTKNRIDATEYATDQQGYSLITGFSDLLNYVG